MVSIRTNNLPKLKPDTPVMVDTLKAFRLTLDNAVAGQKIIYYTGHLFYDRQPDNTKLSAVDKREICKLADAAYDAYMVGKVHLLQKRLARNKWEYFAVVRRSGAAPTGNVRKG